MSEEAIERIRRLVIPMVQERSREPGDAWDQAARDLGALAVLPGREELARVIHPEAFAPPNHWTVGNVAAAQEMARRLASTVLSAFSKAPQ